MDESNDTEVLCSYCKMTINPGRGVHGIGRKSNVWLHTLCKMTSDRTESKYLRSHGFDVNQENVHKSRRKSPAKTDGSNEETSQPGTNHQMALTEAENLQYRIRSESSLKVVIHRIGNGEFVLVIEDYFYIWSDEDWNQLPEVTTSEVSIRTEPKSLELVY